MAKSPFLIVGAMKSGTTGIFKDLALHPEIYVPHDEKEPEALISDDVLSEEGLKNYLSLFSGASSDQIFGEASTAYAKLPDYTGAPKRAKQIFGSDLKIIYIVRDPVDRIQSHHHHDTVEGKLKLDINEAIHKYEPLLNYSKYFYQISQWISEFGSGNVIIIKFEDYKADRKGVFRSVIRFLEVDDDGFESIKFNEVYNKSEGKPLVRGVWKRVSQNIMYRNFVRPLVGWKIRRWVRHSLVPKSQVKKGDLSEDSLCYIASELHEDNKLLGDLMGLDGAPWDLFDKGNGSV